MRNEWNHEKYEKGKILLDTKKRKYKRKKKEKDKEKRAKTMKIERKEERKIE